jgi:3-deoxy-D-manno-octulosonate 8-phosphate phosphatase (KDO 8-P phosphatase)
MRELDAQATPSQAFGPGVMPQAQAIRALLLDVDGVLTDGGLLFGAEGEQLKRFDTLDGHGIKLLARAGLAVWVLSGRDSPALRARLAQLGIEHSVLGAHHKLAPAQRLLDAAGLSWPQLAVMGDDWPDLPLLRRCGLALAPANAHEQVLAVADWVSGRTGGHGAVRQACDALLHAQGRYAELLMQDSA